MRSGSPAAHQLRRWAGLGRREEGGDQARALSLWVPWAEPAVAQSICSGRPSRPCRRQTRSPVSSSQTPPKGSRCPSHRSRGPHRRDWLPRPEGRINARLVKVQSVERGRNKRGSAPAAARSAPTGNVVFVVAHSVDLRVSCGTQDRFDCPTEIGLVERRESEGVGPDGRAATDTKAFSGPRMPSGATEDWAMRRAVARSSVEATMGHSLGFSLW